MKDTLTWYESFKLKSFNKKSLTKKDNNMKKLEDLLEACGIKTMSEDEMLEMLKQTSQWANEDSRKEALIDPLNSFA